MNNRVELMAPAGSWDAISAAIKAGADAVYFGLKKLDMRSRAAHSFDIEDLPEIVSICRDHGVRTYLTLNTLVYDEDMEDLDLLISAAKDAGISAVICSDISAITRAYNAGLEVHISTQTNVSNIDAVKFFSQFADVIVLARELTLDQVASICSQISDENIRGPRGELIKIEIFVHGALCVSIAGKCYMSLALYGHSANRGDCFQTCRRKFRVYDEDTGDELVIDNKYVMSPADVSTISIIDKLINAGTSVFKIEGRGRSADYVYKVTRAYRQAIDSVADNSYSTEKIEKWTTELKSVFNRGFWEKGYYLGKQLGEWSGTYGSQATEKKIYIGKPVKYYPKAKIALIKIETGTLSPGDKISVTGPTTGFAESEIKSIYLDDKPVEIAVKGQTVSIPFEEKIRPSDKVFLVQKREK